ncbi:MAG: hydroxymethylbilane synthase [Nitrospirota bacterium]
MKEIIIGTRGSKLALAQSDEIAAQLKKLCPNTNIRIKIIKTRGDKITDIPLSKIAGLQNTGLPDSGKGLFIKELEEALLSKEIHLAVHSMKDVPTEIPSGLMIGAITKRLDPRDVLISKNGQLLDELPMDAVIGTSSLRRKVQLIHYRSDLKVVDLRGNVDTRLKKLESNEASLQDELQAIVVAAAGLLRLHLEEKITYFLSKDIILPAAGQGALGIEIREDAQEISEIVGNLNDDDTCLAVTAERAFLEKLGGGCQIPAGVFGWLEGNILKLEGVVAELDGQKVIRAQIEGILSQGKKEVAVRLGKELAMRITPPVIGQFLGGKMHHEGTKARRKIENI